MRPATTLGVRLKDAGALELVEVPVPEPGPGEALVRVISVGLCGSDAHWFEEGGIGDASLTDPGLILGHEFTGVIESGPRSGERVVADPAIPCQQCEMCSSGRPNLCLHLRFAGHGMTDGALRGHLVWPERCLVPLPDSVPHDAGAMLEPLGIALHAIDLAGPTGESKVAVIGCGPIGLLLVAALRQRGVGRIVATDMLPHRAEKALAFGAADAFVATESNDEIESLTAAAPGGFDVVFDAAGSDSAMRIALAVAAPGGRVALVGIPTGDRTSFVASLARRKELTLLLCRRMLPQDLSRAVVLVGDGSVDLEGLVSHRFSLPSAGEAFSTLVQRSGLKVLVEP